MTKTILTPANVEVFCAVIRDGGTIDSACAAVPMSKHTYRDWYRRGKRSKTGRYRDFWQAYQDALAGWEAAKLDLIERAAAQPQPVSRRMTRTEPDGSTVVEQVSVRPPDWRAAAWLLEHRFPDRYGRAPAAAEDTDIEPVIVEFVHVYPDTRSPPPAPELPAPTHEGALPRVV